MSRDKKISLRVTEEEKRYLESVAEEKGYNSLSELILSCLENVLEIDNKKVHLPGIEDKVNERLYVRVTKEEKRSIQENAKEAGLNVSRYVRNCCIGKSLVIIPDVKEFGKALNKVGGNLNQIARLCNQGLIDCPDISETKEVMKEIYKELTKLTKKIQPRR